MDIFEAINTRHSVSKVKADALPRDVIEKLLDAGNRAPNHYKVRPWRFFVLTGNGRNKLGDVMAASQQDRQPDLPPEGLDKTRALPLRAPVVIAVGVDKPVEPKVIEAGKSIPLLLPHAKIFCLPLMPWDLARSGAQEIGHAMQK